MKLLYITVKVRSVEIVSLLAANMSAQDSRPVFEEVLVTAEKRSESLQD